MMNIRWLAACLLAVSTLTLIEAVGICILRDHYYSDCFQADVELFAPWLDGSDL